MNLYNGDCIEVLQKLEDNSVDSIVTDPPYGLSFMGKKWDYDVPSKEIWMECLRVLKPGGHILSFGGTRTYHRMTVEIEDAGFEIRDQIMWVYGSGFPKNYNIGKNLDKYLKTGNASWNGTGDSSNGGLGYTKSQVEQGYRPNDYTGRHQNKGEITHPGALQWEGWGTALKPAHEPIVMARKPLSEKNIAQNVLKWGTGGINIDDCRVSLDGEERTTPIHSDDAKDDNTLFGLHSTIQHHRESTDVGRFPANFIHDGSDEVVEQFPNTPGSGGSMPNVTTTGYGSKIGNGESIYHAGERKKHSAGKGSAARFFYCPKSSKKDRNAGCEDMPEKQYSHDGREVEIENPYQRNKSVSANNHPTVKPLALMGYLCRLVTQPGGVVLDPFMGSGSTGRAAVSEGFDFIGIEREPDYFQIAEQRITNE